MAPLEYRQLGSTDMKVSSLSFASFFLTSAISRWRATTACVSWVICVFWSPLGFTTELSICVFCSAGSGVEVRCGSSKESGSITGASSLGSVFHSTKEEESLKVVNEALKLGLNYIDTAPWYGHGKSESVLGKALSGVSRQDYYLSTKVGRYEKDPITAMFDFSAERTLRSIDESLMRLCVPYVDVIQVHDMEFAPSLDIIINETLPALQKVKDSGKARYIGITGYPLENFRKVLDRSSVQIDTILTYCRYSMNDKSLLDYMPYFKSKGVGIINASPLSMGLLTNRGPPDWHPAKSTTRHVCSQATEYCQAQDVDISKLAMNFSHSYNEVATTLFSTSSLENLKKSIDYSTCELSHKEQTVLDNVTTQYFNPLGNDHWEGIEVQQYWNQMPK